MKNSTSIHHLKNDIRFKPGFELEIIRPRMAILFCLCFFINFISSSQAEILYQHNFDNIGYPPTQAQLNTSTIGASLHPTLISEYTFGKVLFTRVENGDKALAIRGGFIHRYTLKLTIPTCKKLEITSIAFQGMSGDHAELQIAVNERNYGTPIPTASSYKDIRRNTKVSDLRGIVTVTITARTTTAGNYAFSSIDDFTIEGSITDDTAPLGTVSFTPNSSSVTSRCQWDISPSYSKYEYPASVTTRYKTFQYSLDPTSLAGGVQISAAGIATFPTTFVGETTITATATGCMNESASASFKVLNKPSGVPMTEVDYKVVINGHGEPTYVGEGCYFLGAISDDGVHERTLLIKMRLRNNVRYFDIDSPPGGEGAGIQFIGRFTQDDFNNYSGSLPLPKSPTDVSGIANVRIHVFYDGSDVNGVPDAIIKPNVSWNDFGYWSVVIDLAYGLGPNTKIFLSDAESALPVKLARIDGKVTSEGNQVSWRTTEETDFSHFELERSEDPRKGFNYLATVASKENHLGGEYKYLDTQRYAVQQYYRLKMVDFDQSFEYSKIVKIVSSINQDELVVYPNPAQNSIFLRSPNNIKSVKLIDAKGQKVFSQSFQETSGTFQVQLPKLQTDTYYLIVNPDTEIQKVRKLVIK